MKNMYNKINEEMKRKYDNVEVLVRNRTTMGLIFLLFGWLQQIINQLNVMEINPTAARLLNQNSTFGNVLRIRLLIFE